MCEKFGVDLPSLMTITDFSCGESAEEEIEVDKASASSFAKVVLPTHGVPAMMIKGIFNY